MVSASSFGWCFSGENGVASTNYINEMIRCRYAISEIKVKRESISLNLVAIRHGTGKVISEY